MTLSIIIPCFNERWRLSPTLSEIVDFTKRQPGIIDEVVIVDDGSDDRTIERALGYKDRLPLTLVQHTENKGKWTALRTGIEVAKNNHVLLLDADGSASVRELERMGIDYVTECLLKSKIALFGSRFLPESRVDGKSNFRKVISRGYRLYVRTLFRLSTGKCAPDDMQCPFKLFPKDQLTIPLTAKQWAGDIELAASLKCRIDDVPISFVHKGGSKIQKNTILTMAWLTAKLSWEIRGRLRGYTQEKGLKDSKSVRKVQKTVTKI